ncbi:MAG TPA: SufE family protein [Nevskiaceae bacterium]|nr:SufE family protein [Nevskiaceae bacterium]
MDTEELVETFELLGDWEERYRYLIELGRQLPPYPEAERDDAHQVRGCISQVWLTHRVEDGRLQLMGDSDAHIVRGLVALLLGLTSGRRPQEILALDLAAIFERLGLGSHLSANRRNGFFSMVERIRGLAQSLQAAGR